MNSPAIRHSKKHRQSQPVVSWLSEAVKEGQWNNDAEKYYGISPYAYCGGDPVNLGDYDGESPTYKEARNMAAYVYGDVDKLYNKWELDGEIIETDYGLQYAVFKRGNERVIAFAGTQMGISDLFVGSGFEDLANDLFNIQGWFNDNNIQESQYILAQEIARNMKKEFEEEGITDLTFVGHSLGASLSAVAGLETGNLTCTFNPLGLHQNTIESLGLQESSDSNIYNYVIQGEIVNKINVTYNLRVPGTTHVIINSNSYLPISKHSINSFPIGQWRVR